MSVLWLVRCSETNISSATETSDSRMISAVNGSILLSTAMKLRPRLYDQVAAAIQPGSLTGVDHRRGRRLLDDRRAVDDLLEPQAISLDDERLVDAVLVEVDPPPLLDRSPRFRRGSEGAEVWIGHADHGRHVQGDELRRRLEPEHVRALVPLAEAGHHLCQRQRAAGDGHAHGVLLADVAHIRRPGHDDVRL